jgi:hypothetical protein
MCVCRRLRKLTDLDETVYQRYGNVICLTNRLWCWCCLCLSWMDYRVIRTWCPCTVGPCGLEFISPVLMVDLRHILEQMLFSVMIFDCCGYIQIYFKPELTLLVVTSLIHAAEHVVRDSYTFSLCIFFLSNIQGVPGGMCQTSGECSLC